MDEASALVAWGRQVLANRRLQKHRERLQREKQHADAATAQLLRGHTTVDSTEMSWASSGCREVAAQSIVDEALLQPSSGEKGMGPTPTARSTAPPRMGCVVQSRSRGGEGEGGVAQLKRRVGAAKLCVQELQDLQKRNEEAFLRRQGELRSMVEESNRGCTRYVGPVPHAAATAAGHNGVRTATPSQPAMAVSSPRQKLGLREQFDELCALQNALQKSQHEEEVGGAAVAVLTACAGTVHKWDDLLWQQLREAFHGWRLRLLPSLRRFRDLVEELPALLLQFHDIPSQSSPLPQHNANSRVGHNAALAATSQVTAGSGRDATTSGVEGHADSSLPTHSRRSVVLPAAEEYPALEWLEALPVEESIDVVLDALARAGAETAKSLLSLIELSDQKEAQLTGLLAEAERQLQSQDAALDHARELLEKLQEEKTRWEADGAILSDAVEPLQERVLAMKLEREQQQAEERELAAELRGLHIRVSEAKESLYREVALRGEALRQAEGSRQRADAATQEKELLEGGEMQQLKEQQRAAEDDVLRVRRVARVAREEEEDAAELRRRHCDEFRVAQAALQAATSALVRHKQQHEEGQAELVSLRCRAHELQAQIAATEEGCKGLTAELEVQRGVEADVSDELARVRAEIMAQQKEIASLQLSVRRTAGEQEAAQAALLYHRGVTNTGAVATHAPRSIADVMPRGEQHKSKEECQQRGAGGSTGAARGATTTMRGDERSSPRSSWIAGEASREAAARGVAMEPLPVMLRTRDEAVEVTLAPRGLQRDQEELQEMRSRYMRDRPPRLQQWRLLQDEKELLQPAARSSCVSPLAGNGCENNDQRNVPLTVLRPSRRDMPSRLADASEELYVTMLPRRRAFSAQGG